MSTSRPLGPWSATALVVGSMIGSGVFLLPASLAHYGGVSLIGWAITLAGAMALAVVFARLAMRWPHTGGPYVFARNAFGNLTGFLVAWSYWISIWCATAAIAVAFAGSVGALFPPATATPTRAAALALGSLWICVGINLLGVREAGRAQLVLTVLKFAPLLAFACIAIWFIEPARFVPFNPSGESMPAAINATVALSLWALLGLETATVPAGAIDNPERTIPRATVIGTLLAGIATVLAVTAVLGLLPAEQLKASQAPMVDAASALWGRWAGIGIALVAAVSCIGALNGWVLVSGQVPLAAARDGLLPAPFARVDRSDTPRIRPGGQRRAGLTAGGGQLQPLAGAVVHLRHPAVHRRHLAAVPGRQRGMVAARRHPQGHRPVRPAVQPVRTGRHRRRSPAVGRGVAARRPADLRVDAARR